MLGQIDVSSAAESLCQWVVQCAKYQQAHNDSIAGPELRMPASSWPLCCGGCGEEEQDDSDPYSIYADTKQIIDSVSLQAKAHAQQSLEASKRQSDVSADDAASAREVSATSSLQRLQRTNPFQGVATCPSLLFVQGAEARTCAFCQEAFGVRKHKHHCRLCGLVFHAGRCSRKEKLVASSQAEPVTVCAFCYGFYVQYRTSMQKGKLSSIVPSAILTLNLWSRFLSVV